MITTLKPNERLITYGRLQAYVEMVALGNNTPPPQT